MNRSLVATFMVLLCLSATGLPAADWPQFRHDNARSAASAEQLADELHLAWRRELPPPRPAFPAEVRLRFDGSYEPVVAGKTLFLPSMVTDTVTALDTETGEERWRFFAEGPVRFAPVAWEGNVYFVSDDGYLYCVSAADGTLRWKYRNQEADQADRRLLGHGRLISLRPARGGPVLKDGILYFGAGIWSTHGVAVQAIDAETGKPLWANTESDHIARANMDHCVGNEAGLSPQGYLAMVHDTLVVPCGAQLPAFLDPKTGAVSDYTMGWGGRDGLPKGTWFVAGTGNVLSHGGDLYDLARPNDERFQEGRWNPELKTMLYPGGRTRLDIDPTNQKDLGSFRQPVFADGVMYSDDGGEIVARRLAEARLEERSKSELSPQRRDDTYPDKWKANFAELWRMPSKLQPHIKAGDHLYLGGKGTVAAVRIPQGGAQPQIVWQAIVDGTPHSMLAADGKLFVVTAEGGLYAFADKQGEPIVHALPKAALPADAAAVGKAEEVLRTSKVRDGYALVLGITEGRLVEQLLEQSELYVIAIDNDAARVAALRGRLFRAGLYGTRASVHVGDPLVYPLPPYLASLVVSEDWSAAGGSSPAALARAVFHPLRPYGGTACLALPAAERETLVKEFAEASSVKPSVRQEGELLLVSREGPLPGSAPWSHAEADAANTGASEDRFLTAPVEILWFDGPARWIRTPGATLVRVAGGRMFLKAKSLMAVDVFTGRRLWEADLPFPHTVNDEVIALDDAVYVAGGRTCVVLDPATGRETKRIELPAELDGPWANLRVAQNYLLGQSGNRLLCLDRASGRIVWQQTFGTPALSIAVGSGRVYCAELANKRRGEDAQVVTRALALATGELVWEQPGGSTLRYGHDGDLLIRAADVFRGADGSVLARLPDFSLTPGDAPNDVPRPLFVVGRKLLVGTAEKLAVYSLPEGKPTGETMTWTRRGCTVPRASSNMVTTRVLGNAACIDLKTGDTVHFWNVRAACSNNLFPADGLLNMPSLTGGCTCNYLPVSQAFVPAAVIARSP